MLSKEKAELAEQLPSVKDELQRVLGENVGLKDQLNGQQSRLEELQGELEEARLLQNPSKIPPGQAVLKLREMQARVQALSLSLRSQ